VNHITNAIKHILPSYAKMESKSYYPANVDTQQYIIQYNFIKIKKMVKEN